VPSHPGFAIPNQTEFRWSETRIESVVGTLPGRSQRRPGPRSHQSTFEPPHPISDSTRRSLSRLEKAPSGLSSECVTRHDPTNPRPPFSRAQPRRPTPWAISRHHLYAGNILDGPELVVKPVCGRGTPGECFGAYGHGGHSLRSLQMPSPPIAANRTFGCESGRRTSGLDLQIQIRCTDEGCAISFERTRIQIRLDCVIQSLTYA
jgi:hypothetical protein